MKIKQMNQQERPREKALLYGMEHLSNRELLAILLHTGSQKHSVLELADIVLHKKQNLVALLEFRIDELMQIPGIKSAKATQLMACFTLCQRICYEQTMQKMHLKKDASTLPQWIMQKIGHKTQEHFLVVFLDYQCKILAHKIIFIGTAHQSIANPRDIFIEALHHHCSRIICAHNHPSGNITPSRSDYESANAIDASGRMLGIHVLDHIIVSSCEYFSMREHIHRLFQNDPEKK